MLEKAELDAVSIVTPDATHFAIAMEALERGLHVLLEKPLAMDSQQARMLMEKASAKKKVNMVAFTFRYTEAMRKLRSLVDEGLIGVQAAAVVSGGDLEETWCLHRGMQAGAHRGLDGLERQPVNHDFVDGVAVLRQRRFHQRRERDPDRDARQWLDVRWLEWRSDRHRQS